MGNDDKDLWIVRCIGKPTCIGHHATIDACSGVAREFVKRPELINQLEDQLTCARSARTRHDEIRRFLVGPLMMIDHDSLRLRPLHHRPHVLQAMQGIEVQKADQIGLLNELCRHRSHVVVRKIEHTSGSRQPFQEVRARCRQNHAHLFAKPTQVVGPSQRRSHGISVGSSVRSDYHTLRIAQQSHQFKELFIVQQGSYFHCFKDYAILLFPFSDLPR